MAANYDIQLKDNDLLIQNGDFVIDASDQQHIEDTILAFPNWWKEFPLDGVGVAAYLNSPENINQQLSRAIKIQLTSDGYQVGTPKIEYDSNNKLIINPNAVKI